MTTVQELREIVRAAGRAADFSIRLRPQPDMRPENTYVVEPSVEKPGHWVVYYTERGRIWSTSEFTDEQAACVHVQDMLAEEPDRGAEQDRPSGP